MLLAGGLHWNDSPGDKENHPINCVYWEQARVYCLWAGGRLPSESEWEYAARSGGQDITYPWGNEAATCAYAVMNDSNAGGNGCGTGGTMPVCSKPTGNTSQGLCDMSGNVWEWVQDWHHGSYDCAANPAASNCNVSGSAPTDGSPWEAGGGSDRVLRGGSWSYYADDVRAANRGRITPSYRSYNLGFRCASSPFEN